MMLPPAMEEACPSCPLCEHLVPITGLERHVNSHLDEAERARDHALALELASTSQSPSVQDSESWKSSIVTCTKCNAVVPLKEWESHDLMHEIQDDEYIRGHEGGAIDCALKLVDNVAKNSRKEDCSSTSVSGSVTVGDRALQSLTKDQKKGDFRSVEEGIMNLIRDCFYSENRGFSCTVMSAHIDHFESRTSEDVGWGCGWRNIQMLSSHLLTHQWGKEVLFGGASLVPDIPSLQQWLEFAWASGFDEPGAEFYNYRIHGSKEWIGTAECAALFRSFGLRACIVDFSTAGGTVRKDGQATIDRWLQRQASKSSNTHRKMLDELPVNTEIHHNIECDICGVYPIKGNCFKSKKRANYDLCAVCILSVGKADDYEKVNSSKTTGFKRKEVASDEDVDHEALVKWVWNYFTDGIEDPVSKASINLFQGLVAASSRSPLYFQHQGHSRTIVGMQRHKKSSGSKEEVFLLVLDPSTKTKELIHALRSKKQWQKLIKRGVHTLKKRSYQVCYVEQGVARGEELQQLKILRSERFSY